MALEPEIRIEKTQTKTISTTKWSGTAISLSIGFVVGFSIFLIINASFTTSLLPTSSPSPLPRSSSNSATESVDAVAFCRAWRYQIYTPGRFPGGSDDVMAALDYCNSLG